MSSMMEYKGYHAKIEYSDEDETLIGKVFGIVDTLIFDGGSVEEITRMFHDTIDGYLALCEEIGKEPEKEFKGSFNVRIEPDLHRKAALTAEQKEVSLNQIIELALENYLNIKTSEKPRRTVIIEREGGRAIYHKATGVLPKILEWPNCYKLGEGAEISYAN